jgi:hypothetical protein
VTIRDKRNKIINQLYPAWGETFFDNNRNALKPTMAQDNNRLVEYKTSHLINSWDLLALTGSFNYEQFYPPHLQSFKIIIHMTSLSQAHRRRVSENFLDLKPFHVNNPFHHHQPTNQPTNHHDFTYNTVNI